MDILELLKQKEEEFQRIQKELEALRIVARMMADMEGKAASPNVKAISSVAGVPLAALSRAEKENAQGFADAVGRQFP